MRSLAGLLVPQAKAFDKGAVAGHMLGAQVAQQARAPTHLVYQPAARGKVLPVKLEVLGEILDVLGEDCDLHFDGSVVPVLLCEVTNDFSLAA